jgi:hypothetical protein
MDLQAIRTPTCTIHQAVLFQPLPDEALVPVPRTMNRKLPTLPNRALSHSADRYLWPQPCYLLARLTSSSLSTLDVPKVIHTYGLNIGGVDVRLSIMFVLFLRFEHALPEFLPQD